MTNEGRLEAITNAIDEWTAIADKGKVSHLGPRGIRLVVSDVRYLLAECDRLARALEEAQQELVSERAFCICGCPNAEHETYDEDEESCGRDDHECLRVTAAAVHIANRLRARAERAEAALDEAQLERPRACGCSLPDPVMQADGKFYCSTCSFQTGARPKDLEPESWYRAAREANAKAVWLATDVAGLQRTLALTKEAVKDDRLSDLACRAVIRMAVDWEMITDGDVQWARDVVARLAVTPPVQKGSGT